MLPSAAAAAEYLASRIGRTPSLAIILGSGFHDPFSNEDLVFESPYSEVPGFFIPKIPGHEGLLKVYEIDGQRILTLSGRVHYYEGFSMEEVTFNVKTAGLLGVKFLLLTNASGAVNPEFQPGDFVIVSDHINFMGINPLRGASDDSGTRFVDLGGVYDPEVREILKASGSAVGEELKQGVYLTVSGPSYETPSEIAMFRRWGADLVGMSTVPEAVVARQMGIRVGGLSCVTNMAAGLAAGPISHEDVLLSGQKNEKRAARLLREFVRRAAGLH